MGINRKTGLYAPAYAKFSTAGPDVRGAKIPVENSHFSTFSTDFSTGVFHRAIMLWIFINGSHNQPDRTGEKILLF
jgi:hypothetical protein